jgi:hypothetical protein
MLISARKSPEVTRRMAIPRVSAVAIMIPTYEMSRVATYKNHTADAGTACPYSADTQINVKKLGISKNRIPNSHFIPSPCISLCIPPSYPTPLLLVPILALMSIILCDPGHRRE